MFLQQTIAIKKQVVFPNWVKRTHPGANVAHTFISATDDNLF